ncbi:alpha/beta fold hydrolase [Pseudomaricurvus alkylphenolicus]|nr:alpha/beta fold hydrolase [Pseudomaricurvus alkylphenolicus]
MLHGGGPGASGMSNYSKNVEALAQHFRVIVPDMQGYGQSSKGVSKNDPFGDLADAMLGMLDTLDIEKAHIIGNSLGGGTALRMALEQPQRVASLVLMGPGGINITRELPTAGLKKLLKYYKGSGPSKDKLEDFILNHLVYDGSQVPGEVIEQRYQSSIDPEVVASPPLGMSPKGMLNSDFTRDPRLKQCQTPCLVLWGADDSVNRPSGAKALQKTMPNCDVYLFSKTGHWVQWERANEFNAVSTAFMLNNQAA